MALDLAGILDSGIVCNHDNTEREGGGAGLAACIHIQELAGMLSGFPSPEGIAVKGERTQVCLVQLTTAIFNVGIRLDLNGLGSLPTKIKTSWLFEGAFAVCSKRAASYKYHQLELF